MTPRSQACSNSGLATLLPRKVILSNFPWRHLSFRHFYNFIISIPIAVLLLLLSIMLSSHSESYPQAHCPNSKWHLFSMASVLVVVPTKDKPWICQVFYTPLHTPTRISLTHSVKAHSAWMHACSCLFVFTRIYYHKSSSLRPCCFIYKLPLEETSVHVIAPLNSLINPIPSRTQSSHQISKTFINLSKGSSLIFLCQLP